MGSLFWKIVEMWLIEYECDVDWDSNEPTIKSRNDDRINVRILWSLESVYWLVICS